MLFARKAAPDDPLLWVGVNEADNRLFEQLESFAALAIMEGIKIRSPRDTEFSQFYWTQTGHKDRSRFVELSVFSGLVTQGVCANEKFGTFPIMIPAMKDGSLQATALRTMGLGLRLNAHQALYFHFYPGVIKRVSYRMLKTGPTPDAGHYG